MKPNSLSAWLLTVAIVGWLNQAYACDYPPPPEFAKVAPTAARIFVFRVMALKVREQSVQSDDGNSNYSVWVDADILVSMTLRGETSDITSLHFHNGYCGGVNLTIGHHYLIATSQLGEVIELAAGDRSLGNIDPQYDPSLTGAKNLETNKYVIAAAAAIDGKQAFDSVLDDATYRSLATVPPPPEVKIVTEPCKPKSKTKKRAPVAKKTVKK